MIKILLALMVLTSLGIQWYMVRNSKQIFDGINTFELINPYFQN